MVHARLSTQTPLQRVCTYRWPLRGRGLVLLYLLDQQRQTRITELPSGENNHGSAQRFNCCSNVPRSSASTDPSCCRRGISQALQQDRKPGLEPLPRTHDNRRPPTNTESARNRRLSRLLQNNSQEPT